MSAENEKLRTGERLRLCIDSFPQSTEARSVCIWQCQSCKIGKGVVWLFFLKWLFGVFFYIKFIGSFGVGIPNIVTVRKALTLDASKSKPFIIFLQIILLYLSL